MSGLTVHSGLFGDRTSQDTPLFNMGSPVAAQGLDTGDVSAGCPMHVRAGDLCVCSSGSHRQHNFKGQLPPQLRVWLKSRAALKPLSRGTQMKVPSFGEAQVTSATPQSKHLSDTG